MFTTAKGGAASFENIQTCRSKVKNRKGLLDCNQRRGHYVFKVPHVWWSCIPFLHSWEAILTAI